MATETQKTDERRGWTSASNATADRLCAGRHQAQIGIPDESSEDALFGQQIHDALYKGDPSKLSPQQVALYDQHQEINEKLMSQFFGPDREAAIIVKENRYWCQVLDKTTKEETRLRHSAKPDFNARHSNRVLVIEYKSLPGDVPEPASNEQLRDQLVLITGNFGIREQCEIGVAVNQPLVTHSPEICVYGPEDIKIAERHMFDRVRASNNPNAKRRAGQVQCKFCKAKFKCKEYEVWAESLLPVATKVSGLPIDQWTPDMRAYYCEMRGAAKKWLEDCDAEMRRLLEADPKAIPGWKLEEGATQSIINDPQELFARLTAIGKEWSEKEQVGLLDLFMDCIKVNKTDFTALARRVTGLKGKALNKKLEELYNGITEEKQNRPSLGKMTAAELANPEPEKVVDVT